MAKEENSDKSITAVAKSRNDMEIDLQEEQKTEAYQEIMNIDIENINKIVNIRKHYTKQWRTIYEVIQQELFDETSIFGDFSKHCKNNVNEAHNILIDVKNNIKIMAM